MSRSEIFLSDTPSFVTFPPMPAASASFASQKLEKAEKNRPLGWPRPDPRLRLSPSAQTNVVEKARGARVPGAHVVVLLPGILKWMVEETRPWSDDLPRCK